MKLVMTAGLRGLIRVQRAYKIALNDGGKNRFCSFQQN